jgi:hypothetical protein
MIAPAAVIGPLPSRCNIAEQNRNSSSAGMHMALTTFGIVFMIGVAFSRAFLYSFFFRNYSGDNRCCRTR